jgi:hypothetical protein
MLCGDCNRERVIRVFRPQVDALLRRCASAPPPAAAPAAGAGAGAGAGGVDPTARAALLYMALQVWWSKSGQKWSNIMVK